MPEYIFEYRLDSHLYAYFHYKWVRVSFKPILSEGVPTKNFKYLFQFFNILGKRSQNFNAKTSYSKKKFIMFKKWNIFLCINVRIYFIRNFIRVGNSPTLANFSSLVCPHFLYFFHICGICHMMTLGFITVPGSNRPNPRTSNTQPSTSNTQHPTSNTQLSTPNSLPKLPLLCLSFYLIKI